MIFFKEYTLGTVYWVCMASFSLAGATAEVASVRRRQKLPPCPEEPMPGGSSH